MEMNGLDRYAESIDALAAHGRAVDRSGAATGSLGHNAAAAGETMRFMTALVGNGWTLAFPCPEPVEGPPSVSLRQAQGNDMS